MSYIPKSHWRTANLNNCVALLTIFFQTLRSLLSPLHTVFELVVPMTLIRKGMTLRIQVQPCSRLHMYNCKGRAYSCKHTYTAVS